jgi:hypothetical protein
MNASDIVNNKQQIARSCAYDRPTVFSSTILSTITPISSIAGGSTSYASTLRTCYSYACQPTYSSYELRSDVQQGLVDRGITLSSLTEWKPDTPTTLYAYRTLYSTLSTVSSISVTSTLVQTGPSPLVCDTPFHQGTYRDHSC